MVRTDIHRPGAIVPADYDYVAVAYMRVEDIGDAIFLRLERERLAAHMEKTGGQYSAHDHGGNCHICGAHCVYMVVFHHRPSNAYIKTGFDCADHMEWDDGVGESFRKKVRAALEQKAGVRKAKATLEAGGIDLAWKVFSDGLEGRDEATICDMVEKLVRYGSLSDKQMDFLRVLIDRVEQRPARAARIAAEREAAKPVPAADGRVKVEGRVISIKKADPRDQFPSDRMLVKHADGWVVFGTIPASIRNGVTVGAAVAFEAVVKAKEGDPKFGYFSRPTKASVAA